MKVFLLRRLWTVLFLAATALTLSQAAAQSGRFAVIKGRVTDKETRKPLSDVNVFLSGTSLGDATDSLGYYAIEHVPPGVYELVVSRIGYETVVWNLKVFAGESPTLNFKLDVKVLEMPEVEVSAAKIKRWKKRLKKFTELFLGTSENARRCTILNAHVMDFEETRRGRTFKAVARAPIEIDNQALGYKVIFFLEEFVAEGENVRFWGKTQFQELPAKHETQARRWHDNRLRAYQGSFRHFVVSALRNRLQDDGFLVFSMPAWGLSRRQTPKRQIIKPTFLQPGSHDFEVQLAFEGILEIVYTREEEEPDYVWYRIKRRAPLGRWKPGDYIDEQRPKDQVSWIRLNIPLALMDTTGYVYEPYAITTYGYWGWERVADMLPRDYVPAPFDAQAWRPRNANQP
ncbi:MAG: carboxypeptidase-like regulatory domain-containing protein [candidate division KSB1 bacterium]|nr:carboxypeptidase-like regulatory domain-containing protein [candidate division KSB1 bacterium]